MRQPYDLLIIGNSFGPFNRFLSESGVSYLILRHAPSIEPRISSRHEAYADLSTHRSTLNSLEKLNISANACLNIYEPFTMASAWIAEALGAAGMPLSAAEACFDKQKMRDAFETASQPLNPAYADADSWQSVEKFAEDHGFPLILKPKGLNKSLLVSKNNSMEELKTAYQKAVERAPEIYARYAPTKQPAFIVEDYLVGSHHTLQGFAADDGSCSVIDQTVDLVTAQEFGHSDNYIYARRLQSRLPTEKQEELAEAARAGMEAIGMRGALAHVELVATKDGPRILEIGARVGGYRPIMYRLACGIELYSNMLAVAKRGRLDLKSRHNYSITVIELFPDQESTFSEIVNGNKIRGLKSIYKFKVNARIGEQIGKASDGYKAAAVVMLFSRDSGQVEADYQFIKQNVRVI